MFVMRAKLPSTDPAPAQAAGVVALALALEASLVRMARGAGVFDLALGEGLRALAEDGRVVRLGYSKITDYTREVLGVQPSTTHAWMQLARELRERPILRCAVRTGLVSSRKALLVARVATPDDEAAWTAAAASLTELELKKRVTGAGGIAVEEWDVETLLLRMDEGQQEHLNAAVALARCVLGPDAPRWQLVEAIAMEWLGAHGEWLPADVWTLPPEAPADHDEWLALWAERSDEVLGQLEALESANALLDGPESEIRDAGVLDHRLQRLMEARRGSDDPLGRQAELVFRLGVWRMLGFSSWRDYCAERLGLSRRTVRQRIWLEHRMLFLPELREALRAGTLTYTKALTVARCASPFDVAERIAEAAGTTCQQAERDAEAAEDRQNRGAGVRKIWGPVDASATVRLAIVCAQAASAAKGRPIGEGEALAMMSRHFVEVWGPEVVRLRSGIGAARLEVLDRTGGLCAVPGCSRAAEHEHHVTYRSRGGGEEAWNRIGICDAHHLAGIHGGWMTVQGRAGEELTWRLGIQDGEPREVWITEGDDDVSRRQPAG
jgi:hypothetical protein